MKAKLRRGLCLLLCLWLTGAAAAAVTVMGLENFRRGETEGTFTDVQAGWWYYENVQAVYEYGLMNGVGQGRFAPNGTMSLAETVTIAARIHGIYWHGAFPEPFGQEETGAAWYQIYVDYALEAGILTAPLENYNVPATRAQFAALLSRAIDENDLQEINWVDDGGIPDVPATADDAGAIYRMYRAGVLTGSDESGTFYPDSTISRAEAAAVLTRLVDPGLRQSVTLYADY